LLTFVDTGATFASFLTALLMSELTFFASFLGLTTFPPTTLAFPLVPSFFNAESPFSSLRMLLIGRICVFPSLNVQPLNAVPAEKDTTPAETSAFFETSGNDSVLSPLLTAAETQS
jgi:hypothetical protein